MSEVHILNESGNNNLCGSINDRRITFELSIIGTARFVTCKKCLEEFYKLCDSRIIIVDNQLNKYTYGTILP